MISFGFIRDSIQCLFYLHIILVLLNTSRILKNTLLLVPRKRIGGGIFVYQKAAAAGTGEEFLQQRLFYSFRHRIFCTSTLKEVLQLKMSTCFSITLSHFKLFIFN